MKYGIIGFYLFFILLIILLAYPMMGCGGPAVFTDDDPGTGPGPGTSENEEPDNSNNRLVLDGIEYPLTPDASDAHFLIVELGDQINKTYDSSDIGFTMTFGEYELSDEDKISLETQVNGYYDLKPEETFTINSEYLYYTLGTLYFTHNNEKITHNVSKLSISFTEVDTNKENSLLEAQVYIEFESENSFMEFSISTELQFMHVDGAYL
ncbi:hypothetical protein KJ708_07220 [bacterium]|nr:hypothetical protein [bacterium]